MAQIDRVCRIRAQANQPHTYTSGAKEVVTRSRKRVHSLLIAALTSSVRALTARRVATGRRTVNTWIAEAIFSAY